MNHCWWYNEINSITEKDILSWINFYPIDFRLIEFLRSRRFHFLLIDKNLLAELKSWRHAKKNEHQHNNSKIVNFYHSIRYYQTEWPLAKYMDCSDFFTSICLNKMNQMMERINFFLFYFHLTHQELYCWGFDSGQSKFQFASKFNSYSIFANTCSNSSFRLSEDRCGKYHG